MIFATDRNLFGLSCAEFVAAFGATIESLNFVFDQKGNTSVDKLQENGNRTGAIYSHTVFVDIIIAYGIFIELCRECFGHFVFLYIVFFVIGKFEINVRYFFACFFIYANEVSAIYGIRVGVIGIFAFGISETDFLECFC